MNTSHAAVPRSRTPVRSPEEVELEGAIAVLLRGARLPPSAEIEPGSFLFQIHSAWRHHRDGRRGHLGDQEIANRISVEVGRSVSRGQFQSMFGSGKRLPSKDENRYRVGIPMDIASAYVRLALTHWSRVVETEVTTDTGYESFRVDGEPLSATAIELVIENARKAMLATIRTGPSSAEEVVYCRQPPGIGPMTFYAECGENDLSVLISTSRDSVVMEDIGEQMEAWEGLLRLLLLPKTGSTATIHIWVVKEPTIEADPRHIKAILGIAQLQKVLMIERAMGLLRASRARINSTGETPEDDLWNAINTRCIVAVKINEQNNSIRWMPGGGDQIDEVKFANGGLSADLIFPRTVPKSWIDLGATTNIDDLVTIVTVATNGNVNYAAYSPSPLYVHKPAVRKMDSPSMASDSSYFKLFEAARAFAKRARQDESLLLATSLGWRLFSPEEFIGQVLPFQTYVISDRSK